MKVGASLLAERYGSGKRKNEKKTRLDGKSKRRTETTKMRGMKV